MDFAEYHPGLSKIPPWIFENLQNPGVDFKVQGWILQNPGVDFQNPGGDFAKFYIFAEKLSMILMR